jgi:hypothetical protein
LPVLLPTNSPSISNLYSAMLDRPFRITNYALLVEK